MGTVSVHDRIRDFSLAAAVLLGAACGPSARGQTAPPAPAPSTSSTTSPAAKPDSGGSDQDAMAVFRPILLREGSRLVEARGQLHRDADSGWWKLRVDSTGLSTTKTTFDMTLLPSTMLSEMQHVAESTPNQQVEFEVTGEVYVYRGRNFLLPVHAPKLVSHEATAPATAASVPTSTSAPTTTAPGGLTRGPIKPGDSAQDIMRNLEKSIGPIAKNVAAEPSSNSTAPSATASSNASGTSESAARDNPGLAAPASLPAGTSGPSRAEKLLQEGTAIISRRGKLTRDSAGGGGWLFIFDSDTTGLTDPPVRLLPCLLLEQLEEYARHNGSTAPILISGQVYLYNSRNYLLPTVYRIPRERTKITP